MKPIYILFALWLCTCTIQAQQKVEKTMSFSGKEVVSLKVQIADSITIHTWNKNEVYIVALININDNKDNDAYNTSFSESGNTVLVEANFKKNYFKGRNNCNETTDIYWQVFVPEKAAIEVETINANVNIDGKTDRMKIKSISGYIDLAVPASKQADLELSTISGRIYSNHELALNKKKSGIPSIIKEKMNNGGSQVKLETISGDIFFRKSN